MKRENIKYDLRMRVRKYFQFISEEEMQVDKVEENNIINKLSKSLKEVIFFMIFLIIKIRKIIFFLKKYS